MSSSLLAGVSGLTAAQQMLNVVGNNLANLNTSGFKAQSPLFSDLLYQTLSPASATSNGSGTNPIQVGFGTMTSSIETNFTQGALTTTGNPLDAALQGQGFFVANNGTQNVYTPRRRLQHRLRRLPGRSGDRLQDSAHRHGRPGQRHQSRLSDGGQ